MPPQPWTRAELDARDSLQAMRQDTADSTISFQQFAGRLQQDHGWDDKMSSDYAVGVARSEGNVGQRFLQRSHVTKRAREKYSTHEF
jgi:hypothetical protein